MQKRKLVRLDPDLHSPATHEDREKMEKALWEGWELMVDPQTGDVWIGYFEEQIAKVSVLKPKQGIRGQLFGNRILNPVTLASEAHANLKRNREKLRLTEYMLRLGCKRNLDRGLTGIVKKWRYK